MKLIPYQRLPDDWDDFYREQQSHELPDALAAFYKESLPSGEQSLNNTCFVAVDIETTGLDAQKDDIVSIGLIEFDLQRVYLASARHWLVSSKRLGPDSVIVHGITHSEVADAPPLQEVLQEVIARMAGKQAIVHYRYMEREFFRRAAAECFSCNWLFPVVDTLEIESQLLRAEQSVVAKWCRKKLPSVRLPEARVRYNLPEYENHNALVDALATAELFMAQVAKQGWSEKCLKELWC